MKKPTKKARRDNFQYSEVISFIEEKHKIQTRNFAGYTYGIGDDKPHQDFWHWFLEQNDVSNGCECLLAARSDCEALSNAPDWVKQIVALIEQDFCDQADKYGYIDVWVEW